MNLLHRNHLFSLSEPFCFFTVFFLIFPTALSTDFSPTTNILLNCGSDRSVTEEGRSFLPDSSDSTQFRLSGRTTSTSKITDSVTGGISQTARVFTDESTYEFTVQSTGIHFLRLHFFPFTTDTGSLSDAVFQVNVLDKLVLLANFSATVPIVMDYLLFIPDKNKMKLAFIPKPSSRVSVAFVNAVELFTAPKDLIDNETDNVDLTKTVMETVHRINVGGDLLTPFNDTVWRTWINDKEFLLNPNLAKNYTSHKINYPIDGLRPTPEFAPKPVYSTLEQKNLVTEGSLTNNFNITWIFPVSSGYKHFIRMHFCDIVSLSVYTLKFNVYLNQEKVKNDLHPGDITHGNSAQPFYRDVIVPAQKNTKLSVSIGSSEENGNAILNGLEIMKLNDSSGSLITGFHVENSVGSGKSDTSVIVKVVISTVAVVFILLLIGAVLFIHLRRKYKQKGKQKKESDAGRTSGETGYPAAIVDSSSTASKHHFDLRISLEELIFATDDFDEKRIIGSGGFGNVYKGKLRRNGMQVAVKRGLNTSKQGLPEFRNEIMLLSQIHHRHLVSLVGYCDENDQMLLVYEYMNNDTLKSHLYGGGDGFRPLTWKQRLEICIDAAKGLHYLHTGFSQGIIHRDVKTSNILLTTNEGGEENNYLAKLSDFGLSKIGPDAGETHVSTMVKGSFGYIDPEYFKTQNLTDKSDVYSFGVVMFEILCGRPAIDLSSTNSREKINLAEYSVDMYKRGELESIVDKNLVGTIGANSLRKFGETAEMCLIEKGRDRPKMTEVLWNLQYILQLHETERRQEKNEFS
ncbi:Kinase family protein [Zostera marina]|uniref:Kinase family protein n=1 Tax=Zostera marina TaxID=29655 RepID=A0A0K9P4H4_ZOSMR|nr:Kinase family protein [Zostera marina]